ncbi:MAG: thiamine pyrophosphate-binding protein, partial [Chitinophagaceae bacterium]
MEIVQKIKEEKQESSVPKSPLRGVGGLPLAGVGGAVSGSVAVLEAFIAEGVSTIFGYPGGAIMPIYDALYDYHEKLNHILVRH